jgi:type II secretory pathway component PulJ
VISSGNHHGARVGLTLLEVLAVIVLVAMIAGALAVNLAAVDESASLRQAGGTWQEMDRRARALARTSQAAAIVELEEDSTGDRMFIRLRLTDSHEIISRIELPLGVNIHIEPEQSHVMYDMAGRSIDYQVRLMREDSPATYRWHVHGLTGFIEDVHGGKP